ncbi:unnamed protein product [Nyctereutes procyonoides]|uniref:(raccoon dog) hypothetical protein n=1 Tax=Nyctereutes procyonoides TaxID=34880 RepID=A0A811YRI6_NYCPR|nr:unnamed protein product [Nyctereutes procyonoides]
MCSSISCEYSWEVMPGLNFYKDPEEIEKEEHATAGKAVTKEEFQGKWTTPASEFTATEPEVTDWSEGTQASALPIQQFPTENWRAQRATENRPEQPLRCLKLLFGKGKQNGNKVDRK